MFLKPIPRALSLWPALLSSALLLSGTLSAVPGLNGPEAIAPFLNGKFPPSEPTTAGEWTVQETYTAINVNLPMHVTPYPGTTKLLCVAKEGRIVLFEDSPTASSTTTFLDWTANTFTSSDSGMTWLVFHPQFGVAGNPNRGYVYITYKWKPAGGDGHQAYWRLSRFTVPDNTQAADPGSEQILIQQYDRQEFHDSGCMLFGADGYLYIGIGDEGGANDQYDDGQKINDRLFSGILRIDVDQKPGSHAIRRQPLPQATMPAGWPASFTANYTIPDSNPFVDPGGGNLEEFYAIGVRQPYRFSYDSVSNRFWLAESGQDTREELDLVTPGANFGWPFREGKIARPTGPQPPVVPTTILGTLTEPIWDVAHGIDNCIVGGFVYRGAAFPALTGKFITVDNVSSHIRAHTFDGTTATNTILTDMPSGSVYSGTSTIGQDRNGEPIFVKINGTGTRGRYFKLAIIPATTTKPVWYRFDDQSVTNTSGYVSDNPGNATVDSIDAGLSLVANDDETTTSANTRYAASNGFVPTGQATNTGGIRSVAAGDADGRPGNGAGGLTLSGRFGVLNDFTVELSFNPATGSLTTGYQCFLGLDGTTGNAPNDVEGGVPIQPFRLMRWGRTGDGATGLPLTNGDLFMSIRTYNTGTAAWTYVPIKVLPAASFTANKWYHLAIVGNVSAGTVTVYSCNPATHVYTQLGQASGYIGNLQSNTWSVGRGMYNGGATDYATDARFDEIRIANVALAPTQFLYATVPYQPVIVASQPPALLSQTGAFSNLATLTPAQGVFPYGVNAPLWSDGAAKQRWIAVPNDGSHNTAAEKIGFKPEGDWSFPTGTVFIKHFELPTDEANPSVRKRLETRFIIMPTSGEPYGVTYKWRADNSDADLLPDGLTEPVTITETGGGTHLQNWVYPSRSDCRICHNGNANYVLGLKTQQLNGDLTYARTGRTANQLETMDALGWFDSGYQSEFLPWFLKSRNLNDTSASLEDRVRSYLDSNCAQCHRPGGVRALFDARYTTPLGSQGLVRGELESSYFDAGDRVIAPGDLTHSILKLRHGTTGALKMPPIAKNVVDETAVQVISDWILSLPAAPVAKLTAPPSAGGTFQVAVEFSEPVTGLTTQDFSILGGTVNALSGSGMNYSLTVVPTGFSQVSLSLPAGKVQGSGGQGNFASNETVVSVIDANLLTWLKFDDSTGISAFDSSLHENQGTLVGMESIDWIVGRFGSALAFDGSGERVTTTNAATGDFSISFWLRTSQAFPVTNAPSGGWSIATADSPGATNDFMIAGTQAGGVNRISFQTGHANGTANTIIHGTTAVNTGQWVHVAVTRVQSTGVMKLYINGVLEATGTGGTDLLGSNPVLSLGGTGTAATSLSGDLDQLRIHSRVLSVSEITGLQQETGTLPPYQQWLSENLPGLTHLQGLDADPEHDGLNNFGEFAFGGIPLVTDTRPVPLTRLPNGTASLTYLAHQLPAGATYQVQISADLSSWQPAAPGITQTTRTPIPGTRYDTVTVTYQPPNGMQKLFFRVLAQPE